MNRTLLVVLGVLIGVVGTLLILRILTVPPPAFTGASFSNNAPPRVVANKKVRLYYWRDRELVPTGADRQDPKSWGNDFVEMTTKNGYFHSTGWSSENVVATAVVVEATLGATTETYINFVPDVPLPTGMAISSVAASLEPGASADSVLQAQYFFGALANSDMSELDVTFLRK